MRDYYSKFLQLYNDCYWRRGRLTASALALLYWLALHHDDDREYSDLEIVRQSGVGDQNGKVMLKKLRREGFLDGQRLSPRGLWYVGLAEASEPASGPAGRSVARADNSSAVIPFD